MHPLSVIDRHWIMPALDPLSFFLIAFGFVVATVATARRPGFGVAILAGIAPFDFGHALFGTTIGFPKAALIGVIVGLFVHRGAIARMNWSALWPRTAGFIAILCAISLSAVAALDRNEVLRELLKWSEYLGIFACAYVGARLDDDYAPAIWGFLISTGVVCASALAELFIGAPSGLFIGSTPVPRIAGFLEGPNQLGGFLEVTIAALAAMQIAAPSRVRAIFLGVAALTLFLTFSRGSYVGLAVVVLVLVIVQKKQSLVAVLPIGSGIAAGVLSSAALLATVRLSSETVLAQSFARVGGAYAGGVGNRAELWRAALFFFRNHPLFGIGAGNFELRLAEAGVHGVRTHANSWYLQALAEGGVALFSATLFFLYTILNPLRTALSRSPWALAAFAATIALAMHQTLDYLVFFPKVAEPWIVVAALGLAASDTPHCDS